MEPGLGGKAASLHREDREVMAWQTLGNAERQRTQGNTGARASAKHGHGWNGFTGSGSAGCSLEGCVDSGCSGCSIEGCGCAGCAVEVRRKFVPGRTDQVFRLRSPKRQRRGSARFGQCCALRPGGPPCTPPLSISSLSVRCIFSGSPVVTLACRFRVD